MLDSRDRRLLLEGYRRRAQRRRQPIAPAEQVLAENEKNRGWLESMYAWISGKPEPGGVAEALTKRTTPYPSFDIAKAFQRQAAQPEYTPQPTGIEEPAYVKEAREAGVDLQSRLQTQALERRAEARAEAPGKLEELARREKESIFGLPEGSRGALLERQAAGLIDILGYTPLSLAARGPKEVGQLLAKGFTKTMLKRLGAFGYTMSDLAKLPVDEAEKILAKKILAPQIMTPERIAANKAAMLAEERGAKKLSKAATKEIKKAMPKAIPEKAAPVTPEITKVVSDAISDMSGFMFSGSASMEAQSNWFSGSIDKALDFAKARLKSGRGGEPVIRVYRIADIESRGVNKIIDLMESSGKQISSSEYSMAYLKDVKPTHTLKLTRGFETTKEDIINQIQQEIPKAKARMPEAVAPVKPVVEAPEPLPGKPPFKGFVEGAERGEKVLAEAEKLAEAKAIPKLPPELEKPLFKPVVKEATRGESVFKPDYPMPMWKYRKPPAKFAEYLATPEKTALREASAKLVNWIKLAKPLREEFKIVKHAELQRKSAAGAAALRKAREAGVSGEAAFEPALAKLGKKVPTKELAIPPEAQMKPKDIAVLFNEIADSTRLMFFRKINTSKALAKVLSLGVPTEGEMVLLENVFGSEVTKAFRRNMNLGQRVWSEFINSLNIPRALQASFDMSAPLRQGILLTMAYPEQAVGAGEAMFKAGFSDVSGFLKGGSLKAVLKGEFSEQAARAIDDIIRNSPLAQLREESELYLAPIMREAGKLLAREEAFVSKFADMIPGIKQSSLGYVTYLNKLRADVFDSIALQWLGEGGKTKKDFRELADFINLATGRGSLGGNTNKLTEFLQSAFFSPRLVTARLTLPFKMWTYSPATRRIAVRSMAKFLLPITTVSALINLSDIGHVEADPRSTEFGKIRIGDTRIDAWGGFQQYIRFFAQIASEHRKTTEGKLQKVSRLDVAERFLQSKLSPAAGLLIDMAKGRSFMGDEMSWETDNVRKQMYNRLAPMFIQDVADALATDGALGGIVASPGFFGVGITSYPDMVVQSSTESIGKIGKPDARLKELELEKAKLKVAEGTMSSREYENMKKDPFIHTTSDLYTDIGDATRYVDWEGRNKDKYSPIVQFFHQSQEQFRQFDEVPPDKRLDYRRKNPEIDALLFFWGKTTVLNSKKSRDRVAALMTKYGIPRSAIPGFIKPKKK